MYLYNTWSHFAQSTVFYKFYTININYKGGRTLYKGGTDTLQGGTDTLEGGTDTLIGGTDTLIGGRTLYKGDGHFTGGTDPMQWVGCQTLCKGWRIDIIQGGNGHYTRGTDTKTGGASVSSRCRDFF